MFRKDDFFTFLHFWSYFKPVNKNTFALKPFWALQGLKMCYNVSCLWNHHQHMKNSNEPIKKYIKYQMALSKNKFFIPRRSVSIYLSVRHVLVQQISCKKTSDFQFKEEPFTKPTKTFQFSMNKTLYQNNNLNKINKKIIIYVQMSSHYFLITGTLWIESECLELNGFYPQKLIFSIEMVCVRKLGF